MLRALVILCVWPVAALGGAWPRAEGETFLSYDLTIEEPAARGGGARVWASLYAEHGIDGRLTLGFDAGSDEAGMKKAILFVAVPLTPPEAQLKAGIEMGAGQYGDAAALRPGLSLGRGMTLGSRQGWISLDTRATLTDGAGENVQTDLTFGLNGRAGRKWILQLQHHAPRRGSDAVRLVPSLMLEHSSGRHLEIGMTAGLRNAAAFGLKLGVWHSF